MIGTYKRDIVVTIGILASLWSIAVHAQNKVVVIPLVDDVNSASLKALEDRITALEASRPFVVSESKFSQSIQAASETVEAVTIDAPANGSVLLEFVAAAENAIESNGVRCSINTNETSSSQHRWRTQSAGNVWSMINGARIVNIAAGESTQYYLVCDTEGSGVGSVTLFNIQLTATFFPTP